MSHRGPPVSLSEKKKKRGRLVFRFSAFREIFSRALRARAAFLFSASFLLLLLFLLASFLFYRHADSTHCIFGGECNAARSVRPAGTDIQWPRILDAVGSRPEEKYVRAYADRGLRVLSSGVLLSVLSIYCRKIAHITSSNNEKADLCNESSGLIYSKEALVFSRVFLGIFPAKHCHYKSKLKD